MSLAEVFVPVVQAPAELSVLVVEDERKMRSLLCERIRHFGLDPLEATTGFEAIRVAGIERPQLIFLDGLLPQMHGFEVSRMIRRIERVYKPFIVLLTSIYKSVRYHNEAKLKYGVDEYVTKPLSDEVLARLLRGSVPQ